MILYVFCTQMTVSPTTLPASVPTTPIVMPTVKNTAVIDAPGGADRLEDADLLALLGDQQHQVADDREGRHQHDDRDDDEQRELLELQRGEEVAVHLHPVAHPVAGKPSRPAIVAADALGVERIGQLHLDAGHAGAGPANSRAAASGR